MARSAATRPTPRSLIPMRGCTARGRVNGPSSPTGHVLMENRHALVVDTRLTLATGTAEREAGLEMMVARPGNHRITLGADKAYDVAGFVADLRAHNVTPHVAQSTTNRRVWNRRADDPPPRLCGQRAGAQAHRGGVWLEQGDRRLSQDPSLWPCPRQVDVHVDDHCLQPRPPAQTNCRRGLATPGLCPDLIFTRKNRQPGPYSELLLQSRRVTILTALPYALRQLAFSAPSSARAIPALPPSSPTSSASMSIPRRMPWCSRSTKRARSKRSTAPSPGLPIKPGRCQTMTHDYKRHGTTTLFAALSVLDGTVIGRCMQRHRHSEFIRFLNAVEREVPAGKLIHAVLDNYATHKHPKVHAPGWRAIRAGPSTSPRPPPPGSTRLRASFPK